MKKAAVLIALMTAFVATVLVGQGYSEHVTEVASELGPPIMIIQIN